LISMISFLETHREPLFNERELDPVVIRARIMEFWQRLYNLYDGIIKKENLNENDQMVLSHMVKLIFFLEKVDETSFNWLRLSVHIFTLMVMNIGF
jgi:hypothetical protein